MGPRRPNQDPPKSRAGTLSWAPRYRLEPKWVTYDGPTVKHNHSGKTRIKVLGGNQYLSRAYYVQGARPLFFMSRHSPVIVQFNEREEILQSAQGAELELNSKSSDSRVYTLSITLSCLSEWLFFLNLTWLAALLSQVFCRPQPSPTFHLGKKNIIPAAVSQVTWNGGKRFYKHKSKSLFK